MIPISPDILMPYKDEEKNITYFFRPLIGEYEFSRDEIIEKLSGDGNQYLEQAKEELKDGTPEQIRIRSREISRSKKTMDDLKEEIKILSDFIDCILVKWEGGPERDPEKRSSRYFKISDRYKLFGIILKINDLTETEAKN